MFYSFMAQNKVEVLAKFQKWAKFSIKKCHKMEEK